MPSDSTDSGPQRLQKLLARGGFGSRRSCEELIVEGRVTVNGTVVSILGSRADPDRDHIKVDGESLRQPKLVYWTLNKPEGVVYSHGLADESLDRVVKQEHGRLFTVGRLDRHSKGLMLVTNDGRLANLLTHPRYKVPKVYKLTLKGNVRFEDLARMERALYYAMNSGCFEKIKLVKRAPARSVIRLTAYEALPGSLRDICLKFGHACRGIERIRIGPLELTGLKSGSSRRLRPHEVQLLQEFAAAADARELDYEGELVKPGSFRRAARTPEFRRKKKGTRGESHGGQKRTMARVKRRKRG